jgi:ribosomal RNA assembly protein
MANDSSPPNMPEEQVFRYELRIPKDRIAVLIGKSGEIKERIEVASGADIDIDSKEGDIVVTGHDVIKLYQLRDIIKAIGRGFNPEIALLLLRPDYAFELIQLNDYSQHKNHQLRMKGRVIGKEGKTRALIEEITEVNITIYGKTVAIIGPIENATIASRAIDMLLAGSPHANVYKWLEKKRNSLKQIEAVGKKAPELKDEYKKYAE